MTTNKSENLTVAQKAKEAGIMVDWDCRASDGTYWVHSIQHWRSAKEIKALAERKSADCGTLCDYKTGEVIRPATAQEAEQSREAAQHDGGRGVFQANDKSVYVQE